MQKQRIEKILNDYNMGQSPAETIISVTKIIKNITLPFRNLLSKFGQDLLKCKITTSSEFR